jgi:hypothetical protein
MVFTFVALRTLNPTDQDIGYNVLIEEKFEKLTGEYIYQ